MKIVNSILKVIGMAKTEKVVAAELDKKDPPAEKLAKILRDNQKGGTLEIEWKR